MKRENVVEIARISKNEQVFMRNFDVINKINLYKKMNEKFKFLFVLYGFTVVSLFTRVKPLAMFLAIVSLFATLFVIIAMLVNKYNKRTLLNKIKNTEIDFYLDNEEKFEDFIYNPINFIDEYFLDIDAEYLDMAVLYFNTKLTIDPDNSLYLAYLRKISKRVEEIEKKRVENKLILDVIRKNNESVVSHIDISACELTEEEKNKIRALQEKEEKRISVDSLYKETKKWYNSLGIGKKL